jgi:hypothetical protein
MEGLSVLDHELVLRSLIQELALMAFESLLEEFLG